MADHLTQDEIFAQVAEKVAAQKGIDVDTITFESRFEDLGVDSLDAMEILFELEDELDLDIPDQAARSMRTVADVVDGLGKLARGEEIELPPAAGQAADGDSEDSDSEDSDSEDGDSEDRAEDHGSGSHGSGSHGSGSHGSGSHGSGSHGSGSHGAAAGG